MQLENFEVGGDNPLFVIAGPCVIESETLIMETATALKELGEKVGVSLIFKAPSIKPIDPLWTAIEVQG